jgi:cytochrome c oxidase subunit 3/cytochrome o ubiquinol oxidase subunit 3
MAEVTTPHGSSTSTNGAAEHHAVQHIATGHMYTSLGVDNRKLGLWALIGSETLFFTALITTYLIYAPINAARSDFQDPKEFLDIELTTLLASLLLASSLTMVLSLAASRRGDYKGFRNWLLATVVLGLGFLGGQVYEFDHLYHLGLTLSSSLFGSTFFVLTGFHGTHVAIGVIWLLAVFFKVRQTPNSPENPMDLEIAGLYWHFVDLVWVAIFVLIYLI